MTDPFSILGVSRSATPDEIKAAYRKLAMQFHPDRNPGDAAAEAKFKEISAAYDLLKDPQRRAQAEQPRRPHPGGFEFHFGDMPFGFEEFFRANGRNVRRNNDVTVECMISLEQAFAGVESATLEIQTRVGRRTVLFTVPAGADNGMRLKISGEGERVYQDLPPGDLYVHVTVMRDAVFERYGPNLARKVAVDAFTALLGGTIRVDVLGGGQIDLEIPAGVQPGQRLRVSGHGMPVVGATEQRGDLLGIVEVTIPTLTDEQRALIANAAALRSV